jgi:hypothetical protein
VTTTSLINAQSNYDTTLVASAVTAAFIYLNVFFGTSISDGDSDAGDAAASIVAITLLQRLVETNKKFTEDVSIPSLMTDDVKTFMATYDKEASIYINTREPSTTSYNPPWDRD